MDIYPRQTPNRHLPNGHFPKKSKFHKTDIYQMDICPNIGNGRKQTFAQKTFTQKTFAQFFSLPNLPKSIWANVYKYRHLPKFLKHFVLH